MEYTDYDVQIATREYRAIQDTLDAYDGPVTCIFSFGYGEVSEDGDVTAHGRVVFTVDTDGVVA